MAAELIIDLGVDAAYLRCVEERAQYAPSTPEASYWSSVVVEVLAPRRPGSPIRSRPVPPPSRSTKVRRKTTEELIGRVQQMSLLDPEE